MMSERCFCSCHTHPGVYPPPCNVCRHDNREGRMIGGYRDGWEAVDQRDARIATLTSQLAAVTAERDAAVARAEQMVTVIADAISVGEMQGEDFRLQPWSTLRAALAIRSRGICPHGHPNCCGHHDLEDMPIHEQGAHE